MTIATLIAWFGREKSSYSFHGATNIVTDRKAKVSERAVFLGHAFGKAVERARKLGWMV